MSHPDHQVYEKVADLEKGLAIYKVHIDLTREQDKNARVMALEKFDRLADNIKKDERLESLPFTILKKNPSGNVEFEIISGHHRTRAARKAGLQHIFLLVDETELSRSEVISKQIAHNALNGHDDRQILAELYGEIDDLALKIASGLTEEEIKFEATPITVDELSLDFHYELIYLLFLESDFKNFKMAFEAIEKEATVYLADKADFEQYKEAMSGLATRFKISNTSAIMRRAIDIILDYTRLRDANERPLDSEAEWIPLNTVIGTDDVPDTSASVIQKAVERMMADGTVTEKNRWQALEYLAADFLAGAERDGD